jgi:hypothetical protein
VVTIYHDLVNLAGSYISIGAIRSILDEVEDGQPTGNVLIDTGAVYPVAFEGSAEDVMKIVEEFCRSLRGGQ